MRTPIAEAIAQLVSERNVLAVRLDLIAAAIETLEKLEGGAPSVVPAAAPPRPRALPLSPVRVKPEALAARSGAGTCEREGCGKVVTQPKQGRARHYCSVSCGKKARKAGVAVTPAPGPQRMPRADRPVDNAELDALIARGKRGAA